MSNKSSDNIKCDSDIKEMESLWFIDDPQINYGKLNTGGVADDDRADAGVVDATGDASFVLNDVGSTILTQAHRKVIRPKSMREIIAEINKRQDDGQKRPSRKMARLLESEGMEGFARGCLYEMSGRKEAFENQVFVEILSPGGRPRMVSEEKIQILDVFKEKP